MRRLKSLMHDSSFIGETLKKRIFNKPCEVIDMDHEKMDAASVNSTDVYEERPWSVGGSDDG